jgi:hypothetical protein
MEWNGYPEAGPLNTIICTRYAMLLITKYFLAVSVSNIRHGAFSLSLQSVIAIAKCP